MPLSDEQWALFASELRQGVARVDPGWADRHAGDPGVTVLELLAFALDELAYRSNDLSGDAQALASEVARRAALLAGAAGASASGAGRSGGLLRPRYFPGQLLDAADLNAEQDYVLDRLSRLHRLLLGAGIVDGLEVTVASSADGSAVVVEPGLAIDRRGREIFVDRCHRVALPASAATLLVVLAYREHLCSSAPLPTNAPAPGIDDDIAARATRIVETFDASLAAAPDEDSVAIARVRRARGRWRVDRQFAAPRVRRAP